MKREQPFQVGDLISWTGAGECRIALVLSTDKTIGKLWFTDGEAWDYLVYELSDERIYHWREDCRLLKAEFKLISRHEP